MDGDEAVVAMPCGLDGPGLGDQAWKLGKPKVQCHEFMTCWLTTLPVSQGFKQIERSDP